MDEKKSTTGDSAIKGPRPASAPLRVLAVDDDEMNLRLIRRILEKLGHSVTPAASGPEGLRLFSEESFDLVVTDLTMPELSGDDIAAEMKAIKPGIPIILVSGYADMMDAGSERPEHVDCVVRKPISMEGISRGIALVVSKA